MVALVVVLFITSASIPTSACFNFKDEPVRPVDKENFTTDYPYVFTTGRILYHYHTRTMTGRVDGINQLAPSSYVEINEVDANRLGINDGDRVKLTSRRGQIETTARITEIIDENVL